MRRSQKLSSLNKHSCWECLNYQSGISINGISRVLLLKTEMRSGWKSWKMAWLLILSRWRRPRWFDRRCTRCHSSFLGFWHHWNRHPDCQCLQTYYDCRGPHNGGGEGLHDQQHLCDPRRGSCSSSWSCADLCWAQRLHPQGRYEYLRSILSPTF